MRQGAVLLRTLGAAVVTVTFVLPLLFMVTGSLREPQLPPPRTPQLLPDPLGLGSYERAFDLVDLGRYALNSLFVAAMVAPLSVLVASLAGFALVGLSGRVTRLVVVASVVALMIPATALIVPRFTLFRALGVTDTYVPLVAPALLATSPLYVLALRLGLPAPPGRSLRRVPAGGHVAVRDLVADGDAARAPGDGRRGRARVRDQLGQLPRPARLPVRPGPLHAAARPPCPRRARSHRLPASCSRVRLLPPRRSWQCSSWRSAGSSPSTGGRNGSAVDGDRPRRLRGDRGRVWRRRRRGRRRRTGPVPRLRRAGGAEGVPRRRRGLPRGASPTTHRRADRGHRPHGSDHASSRRRSPAARPPTSS